MEKQNYISHRTSDVVNAQLEIIGEVAKRENVYKSISFFLIGIFFALLTVLNVISEIAGVPLPSVNSTAAATSNYNLAEIYWLIYLIVLGVGSISAILFIGKSIKKVWTAFYYNILILSVLSLIIAVIVISSINLSSSQSLMEYTQSRANIFLGVGIIVGIVQLFLIGFLAYKTRYAFPSVYSRALLSLPLYIVFIVFSAILRQWVFAINDNNSQLQAFAIVMIVITVALVLYIVNVIIYANLYKESIISNLTNRELEVISRNRDLSFAASFVIGAILIIFPIVISSSILSSTSANYTNLIIGTILSALLVLAYIFIISKRTKSSSAEKTGIDVRDDKTQKQVARKSSTKALENQILYVLFLTIIVVLNTILIAFANSVSAVPQNSSIFLLSVSGVAMILIIGYNNLKGIKFPNIKNLTSTIIVFLLAIFNILIGIIYSSVPNSDAIFALLQIEIGLLLSLTASLSLIVLLVVNFFVVYLAVKSKKSAALQKMQEEAITKVNLTNSNTNSTSLNDLEDSTDETLVDQSAQRQNGIAT